MAARNNGHSRSQGGRIAAHASSNGAAGAMMDNIGHAIEVGTEKAQAALKTVSETAKDVSTQAGEVKDKVTNFIETRPLTSVLLAMGIGALASRMFIRR
jgi:hypothetical protein